MTKISPPTPSLTLNMVGPSPRVDSPRAPSAGLLRGSDHPAAGSYLRTVAAPSSNTSRFWCDGSYQLVSEPKPRVQSPPDVPFPLAPGGMMRHPSRVPSSRVSFAAGHPAVNVPAKDICGPLH
eukprot:Gb_00699 [translate_table: standard]